MRAIEELLAGAVRAFEAVERALVQDFPALIHASVKKGGRGATAAAGERPDITREGSRAVPASLQVYAGPLLPDCRRAAVRNETP